MLSCTVKFVRYGLILLSYKLQLKTKISRWAMSIAIKYCWPREIQDRFAVYEMLKKVNFKIKIYLTEAFVSSINLKTPGLGSTCSTQWQCGWTLENQKRNIKKKPFFNKILKLVCQHIRSTRNCYECSLTIPDLIISLYLSVFQSCSKDEFSLSL